MTSPIFIDANIPIYATGGEHPFREPCREIVVLTLHRRAAFFTNAEAVQEVLYHCLRMRRWPGGAVAVSEFAVAMENRVEPIYVADVLRAGAFAEQLQGLSSRDLIHLAVMERIGADTIITADRAFDVAPGITRLDPAALPGWRATVEA